jgi:hypothetical protein
MNAFHFKDSLFIPEITRHIAQCNSRFELPKNKPASQATFTRNQSSYFKQKVPKILNRVIY